MVNSTDLKNISSSDYKGEFARQQAAKSAPHCAACCRKCQSLFAPPDQYVPPSRALAHFYLLCESLPLHPERTVSGTTADTPPPNHTQPADTLQLQIGLPCSLLLALHHAWWANRHQSGQLTPFVAYCSRQISRLCARQSCGRLQAGWTRTSGAMVLRSAA